MEVIRLKKPLSLALAAALALSLTACGGGNGGDDKSSGGSSSKSGGSSSASSSSSSQGDASEPQEEEREVPGTYENVSLFLTSTIQVSENGSFDRTKPDEKGTYTVKDDGSFELVEKGMGNGDIFTPYGDYYYRSNLICSFDEDEEYGLAPSFDSNGHSNQSFDAYYEPASGGNQNYVLFTMKEDGTYTLQKQIRNTQGFLTVVDQGDTYEGTYSLDGDVLTLTWKEFKFPFLFLDGKIYFDIIEKQTAENTADLEARRTALEAFRAEKFVPVDDALASEIVSSVQGEWEYSNNNVKYVMLFEGNNFSVTTTAGGASLNSQGTYVVCKDFVLITYDTGKRARIDYTYENGEFNWTGYLQSVED